MVEKDFKVDGRQITVGDSYMDKDLLNAFFKKYFLKKHRYSDEKINGLINDVIIMLNKGSAAESISQMLITDEEIGEAFEVLNGKEGFELFKALYGLYKEWIDGEFDNKFSEENLPEMYSIMVDGGYEYNQDHNLLFNLGSVVDAYDNCCTCCYNFNDNESMIQAGKERIVRALADDLYYFVKEFSEYIDV